jgi:hypothetical protein
MSIHVNFFSSNDDRDVQACEHLNSVLQYHPCGSTDDDSINSCITVLTFCEPLKPTSNLYRPTTDKEPSGNEVIDKKNAVQFCWPGFAVCVRSVVGNGPASVVTCTAVFFGDTEMFRDQKIRAGSTIFT